MNTLSSRLTLWYGLAVTLTVAIFLISGRFLLEDSYIEGIDLLNDSEFEEVSPRLLDVPHPITKEAAISAVLDHTEIDAALFYFQIGWSNDEPFFRSSNLGAYYLPESVHGHRRITISDEHLGVIRVGEYRINGYDVHIASSLEGFKSLDRSLLKTGGLILVAIFLTSLVVGHFLSRVALNPIAGIQKTASRINANNLGERIPVSDVGDEIARLSELLNAMFDRLQGSFNQVRRFTADASHELKTPLSLIRLNAEELHRNTMKCDTELSKLTSDQIDEIDRLNRVIDDLLILSKADSGTLGLNLSLQDIRLYLLDFCEDALLLCEDKGLRFEYTVEKLVDVLMDPVWLRNVFFNILSNAIKFSPANGLIRLTLKRYDGSVFVIVEDCGPGVKECDLSFIFDRFYTKSKVRGSGLGLAMCKSIMEQHGGGIRAYNRTDVSGLVVELRFDALQGN